MTTYQLTSNPAHDDLTKLVDEAVREGEVVLTRDGKPVAKLIAVGGSQLGTTTMKKPRVFGRMKGQFVVPPDFDEPLEDMRPYMEGPE